MAARKDSAAFDAFVRDRSARLLRTAHLLLGDRVAAERALTAGLGEAWRKWPEPPDAAEDRALRSLVAAARRSGAPAADGAPGRLPDGLGSSDTARVVARGALRRQLAAMPAELRAVLVLLHADGFHEERVARLLDTDVEQVLRAEQSALEMLVDDEELEPFLVGSPS